MSASCCALCCASVLRLALLRLVVYRVVVYAGGSSWRGQLGQAGGGAGGQEPEADGCILGRRGCAPLGHPPILPCSASLPLVPSGLSPTATATGETRGASTTARCRHAAKSTGRRLGAPLGRLRAASRGAACGRRAGALPAGGGQGRCLRAARRGAASQLRSVVGFGGKKIEGMRGCFESHGVPSAA